MIRLAMPRVGTAVVADLLRGEIEFDNAQIDDQVLLKSDGFPTYHLANVVDDHLMEISHVIRAEEWINSLPKHVALYEAFGWEPPVFCHLPLLRNRDKSKISKRKNPVSLNYYRNAGFLPEAMLNYLARMGWAMPDEREEFSMDEFIDSFQLEQITLGGPVFDLSKLIWLNGRYIRNLSDDELFDRLRDGVIDDSYLRRIIPLVRERIDKLEDFAGYAGFFFDEELTIEPDAIPKLVAKGRTAEETRRGLEELLQGVLEPLATWEAESLEEHARRFCEAAGWTPKELYMPIRIAVTGRTASPPLFETMSVLGPDRCRRRLGSAIEVLGNMRDS